MTVRGLGQRCLREQVQAPVTIGTPPAGPVMHWGSVRAVEAGKARGIANDKAGHQLTDLGVFGLASTTEGHPLPVQL
ncbi:hypothetical protein D3C84_1220400 [compost metagenome]